jgi:hypothetical protein
MGRGLAALVGATLLTLTRPSVAQTFTGGGGLFIGFRFDSPTPSFEWGAEAFATYRFRGATGCTSIERTGAGPLAQVAFAGLKRPRLTLAAHAGGELHRASIPQTALVGELGITLFPNDMNWAVHSGVLFEVAPFVNMALRQQWITWMTTVDMGFRYLPTMGDLTYCVY